jgi:hypothetical protein
MVGVQHAKGASENTKEMVIDMVQMSHEGERRSDEGNENLRAPFASPPSGRGPTYLDGYSVLFVSIHSNAFSIYKFLVEDTNFLQYLKVLSESVDRDNQNT